MAHRKFKLRAMLVAVMIGVTTHATAQYSGTITTGAFPNPSLIESQLRRGASTQSDVQRVLGVPTGTGRTEMAVPPSKAAQAPSGAGPRDVWYYDDIEITDMKSGGGTLEMKERQQILLIFIKAGVFDGYLWTSNASSATAGQ